MPGVPSDVRSERLARVKVLTAEGWAASDIAAELKVSRRTVVRYRRATGCARPAPRRLTTDEITVASELLDDGCSYEEVARTLGVSSSSIVARFPGRSWTPSQISAHGCLHRRFRA